jgi:hypothetical protein
MANLLAALMVGGGGATSSANPQIRFVENFPIKNADGFLAYSFGTLSFQHINIPVSLSFRYPVFMVSNNNANRTITFHMGLYSLNAGTLSLANSASGLYQQSGAVNNTSWVSMATSATQNITPGSWYIGFNVAGSSNNSAISLLMNTSINPGNAEPFFIQGRVTASTNAMPTNVATSVLDITGGDAIRQPYVIITA